MHGLGVLAWIAINGWMKYTRAPTCGRPGVDYLYKPVHAEWSRSSFFKKATRREKALPIFVVSLPADSTLSIYLVL